jgi:hypothetical protein
LSYLPPRALCAAGTLAADLTQTLFRANRSFQRKPATGHKPECLSLF